MVNIFCNINNSQHFDALFSKKFELV